MAVAALQGSEPIIRKGLVNMESEGMCLDAGLIASPDDSLSMNLVPQEGRPVNQNRFQLAESSPSLDQTLRLGDFCDPL